MVVLQSACVLLFLPETRGKDLEATFRAFQHHWFWKRHTGILDVHAEPLPLHVKRLQVLLLVSGSLFPWFFGFFLGEGGGSSQVVMFEL